ncbi:MATE family multidrug resistance protein [Breoghania corrubedonensis]|uniref:Multidrug-efflux transporter n=1 Tax=Breoghania corrubedonensis TaxID=665038 RepID=A0A2T5V7D3_9HYPH|nr:MATE family efflux transporter [Breoghania corrubedonensis]PTW59631.1 MATE family multidrug resistance protein [Breoghania corrubedonensis]
MASLASDRAAQNGAAVWIREIRATLVLGLPIAGAQLAQMAINTTDVLMIGHLGTEPLAASVLAFNLYILIWLFGSGLIQAVMPIAARARGEKRMRDVRRSVRMGLWVVIAYSVPAMVLMWQTEAILLWLGQKPEIAHTAGLYMHYLQWALPPSLATMGIRNFVSVMEMTQVLLWTTLAGAAVNAFFDYVLIFGAFGAPRLELAGAGIASTATATATFALILAYTLRHRRLRRFAILGRFWRSDWSVFFQIVKLGWPIGLMILAEVGLFAGSAAMMGWIGTVPLAAHGIALQCSSITFMVPLGFGVAGTIRIGLAHGRGDHDGIARAGWTTLALSVGFMLCAAIVFWTIPEVLIGAFTNDDNPDTPAVIAAGVSFLAVAAVFQIFDGAQVAAGNILRGLSDTRVPMLIAVAGYWGCGMSLAYMLAFWAGWGGVGLWWGLASGLAFVSVAAIWRFAWRERLGLV